MNVIEPKLACTSGLSANTVSTVNRTSLDVNTLLFCQAGSVHKWFTLIIDRVKNSIKVILYMDTVEELTNAEVVMLL